MNAEPKNYIKQFIVSHETPAEIYSVFSVRQLNSLAATLGVPASTSKKKIIHNLRKGKFALLVSLDVIPPLAQKTQPK